MAVENLGSDISSVSSGDEQERESIADMLLEEPMYYVLAQFLETKENKNIATILEELVTELREVKISLAKIASSSK